MTIELLPDGQMNEYLDAYINYDSDVTKKRIKSMLNITNVTEKKALDQFYLVREEVDKYLELNFDSLKTPYTWVYPLSNILEARMWTPHTVSILPYDSIKNQIYFFELPLR